MITDWIVAIGTIVLALIAAIAIFQDRIRGWLQRPILNVTIEMQPPDCHKTPFRYERATVPSGARMYALPQSPIGESQAYYCKLRINNTGNEAALNAEVIALELLRKRADGTYGKVNDFLPMNLAWSHVNVIHIPFISPGTYKHCDLFHVIYPPDRKTIDYENRDWPGTPPEKTVISFDTVVKAFTLSHLVPNGAYRLLVQVAATNAKPAVRQLDINLTGDWFEEEERMLRDGIGISVIR